MPIRIIPIEPDPIATAPRRRFTPPRVWAPLTDAEWAALAPHIAAAHRAGRKVADPRGRMNAIFHMAVTDRPWRLMPEAFGKPDTISRHFRRWAHAALWLRLLGTARAPDAPKALRAIEYWLCRAARRAMRILGLDGALVAERLGTLTAMPVLPCYMPARTRSPRSSAGRR